jgi:hypothetical protein
MTLRNGYIVGNIAPDCGEWSEDGKTLTPPKYITHWKKIYSN